MAAITADKAIEAFVLLRDQRSDLKHAYDAEDKGLKAKQEAIEAWLMRNMDAMGSTQFKSVSGTAFKQMDTKVSCTDWSNFWAEIQELGRLDFLEKRVSAKAIKEYMAEGNELPVSLQMFNEYKIVVRRN